MGILFVVDEPTDGSDKIRSCRYRLGGQYSINITGSKETFNYDELVLAL